MDGVWFGVFCSTAPAKRAVAHVEGEFEVGGRSRFGSLGLHIFPLDYGLSFGNFLLGIKTKLDNANWFPIRHADTPVQKRFLNKAGGDNPRRFCFSGRSCGFSFIQSALIVRCYADQMLSATVHFSIHTDSHLEAT